MKTKVVTVKKQERKTVKTKTANPVIRVAVEEGDYRDIAVSDISFSPLNYRSYYSEKALNEFAVEIGQHGVTSPVTVRPLPDGKFELVVGERRLRAAQIAKLKTIPAVVRTLTNEQVRVMQLNENNFRENPHPMNEAQGIGMLKEEGKTIDEVALLLGKSRAYIYTRIKLLSLIDEFRSMFVADVLTLQEAVDISAIAADSQQDFYDAYCKDWQQHDQFQIYQLHNKLARFKYDLLNAPFNPKDKKLLPEAGACTTCAHNTATLKSLFPDLAKKAVCNNKTCFQAKCNAHFSLSIVGVFQECKPAAIVFTEEPTEQINNTLALIDGAGELTSYQLNDITPVAIPEEPKKEDFTDDWGDDEPEFDEGAYNDAIDDYKHDQRLYQQVIESGKVIHGILISDEKVMPFQFINEPRPQKIQHGEKQPTSKQVQEAIKTRTADRELLEGEINRLNYREGRSQEKDKEKIHTAVYEKFTELIKEQETSVQLTDADILGMRLLVYQSLGWDGRYAVQTLLQLDGTHGEICTVLQSLTDGQFAYLIRMAMTSKSDTKYSHTINALVFDWMAESAGVDIAAIEAVQQAKAETRADRLKVKVQHLEKHIKNLPSAA